MVISSLVIETNPQLTEQVAQSLVEIPGVEVHETVEYKLVVTIEAETTDQSQQIATDFMEIPGVITVGLVYCNFEDDPTL